MKAIDSKFDPLDILRGFAFQTKQNKQKTIQVIKLLSLSGAEKVDLLLLLLSFCVCECYLYMTVSITLKHI